MDFTLTTYKKLLNSLQSQGFSFMTYAQYTEAKSSTQQINKEQINNLIVLRHDVEARYPNALRMAQIEHSLGIKGSYYFRIFPNPANEEIIKQIAAMGHEIGYHYDDLTACKGNHEAALKRFQKNLAYLRQFAPVTTITMEGAPLSKYDNRDLWKQPLTPQLLESLNLESSNPQILKSSILPFTVHYSPFTVHYSPFTVHYSLFSINAEPYFDLNFNQILYLTDTGRRWDGHLYNVRDKATKENPVTNPEFLNLRFRSTFDLINAIESSNPQQINKFYPEQSRRATNQQTKSQQPTANGFPNQAMLNFHPQRWNDKPLPWLKELFWQNIKNQGKRILLLLRKGV